MSQCSSCGAEVLATAKFCSSCGTPVVHLDKSSGDPLIGQTLGKFRVIAPLGEGAMGKVYRAEDTKLLRPVCIKTLLPHLAGDAMLVQRFMREARATTQLRHPNIVSVMDFDKSDD